MFITWRLAGSLPPSRYFPDKTVDSGRAFATMDRLLDSARRGPVYLCQATIAHMVVEAIHHKGTNLEHYGLYAFAVMPNHVHLLISPRIPLPKITRSLKGITAKRANEELGLTGRPFWQKESYDRLVRDETEFERIRRYIEQNPVRAGLVREAGEYRWSSARWATGGSPANQGVRPTTGDRL